jgi:N-acetylmuramic acid 6-phosphate etherase
MKAGTVQKVVLNLISSGIMLRLGRVYRGMMVNMQPTNAKLKRRAEAMVAQIANCGPHLAAQALQEAEGEIKTAVLLVLGVEKTEAEIILRRYDGNLRQVLAELMKVKARPAPSTQSREVEL